VSSTDDALAELAGRLEGMAEELTDMAIDALRRATSGDPDSAEAGEAVSLERRIVRARRAVEKAVSVLVAPRGGGAGAGVGSGPGSGAGAESEWLDDTP
jgi:Flp pilus assembly protein TadD